MCRTVVIQEFLAVRLLGVSSTIFCIHILLLLVVNFVLLEGISGNILGGVTMEVKFLGPCLSEKLFRPHTGPLG